MGPRFAHLQNAEKLSGKPGMNGCDPTSCNSACAAKRPRNASLPRRRGSARDRGDREYLAEYVLESASGICEANETLAIMDLLRPVYERLPAYRQGMKTWMERRINLLAWAKRMPDAMQLRRNWPSSIRTIASVRPTMSRP